MKMLLLISYTLFCTHAFAAKDLPCLGQALDLNLEENSPFVRLNFAFSKPGEMKQGWFLIDTGCNESYLDVSLVMPDQNGYRPDPANFYFFRKLDHPSFHWNDYSGFDLKFKQMGVVGTNLISKNVYAIDFQDKKIRQSSFAETCTPQKLLDAGFLPLTTAGYFSSNTEEQKLFPAEHVQPREPNPKHLSVPNSPVVPIQIGSVDAVAMIDSGFSDRKYPLSVNINSALLSAVNKNGVRLVKAEDIPVNYLKTCIKGVSVQTTAYRLNATESFGLISTDGKIARSYQDAVFFLKSVPPEAKVCGGIGTWEIPAAQIGASFLKSFGTIVFNAKTQTVWITQSPRH